jgi:hypothetical protein
MDSSDGFQPDARDWLWMNNTQTELLFEGIEIAVAVKQRMAFAETEDRNQAADRLPNGMAACSQKAIGLRRSDCQVFSAGWKMVKRENSRRIRLKVNSSRIPCSTSHKMRSVNPRGSRSARSSQSVWG